MFCTNCGHECPNNAAFCPNCGKAFRDGDANPNNSATHQFTNERKSSSKFVIPLLVVAVVSAFVAAGVFFIGRGNKDGAKAEQPAAERAVQAQTGDTWTVMIYLCGSDLETKRGYGSYNLDQLASCNMNDKVQFVIQTGGAYGWHNADIDSNSLNRYKLANNKYVLEDQQANASMGAPETLCSFITWAAETHPADNYVLVLWDHGGGSLGGVCSDEQFGMESLSLPELSESLSKSGVHFELIGFDACLMASLETAKAVAPFANYMVASEEIEPGYGWGYATWPESLAKEHSMTGVELGKVICDAYFDFTATYESVDIMTLSVIDLSAIDSLSEAFQSVSFEMLESTADISSKTAIARGARATQLYGDSSDCMLDLNDLINRTKTVYQDEADAVLSALKEAIAYERHGQRTKSGGLSVFYPAEKGSSKEYKPIAANEEYYRYAAVLDGEDTYVPIDEQAYEINAVLSQAQGGNYQIKITHGLESVVSVSYALSRYEKRNGRYVYLGTSDLTTKLSGDTAIEDFDGRWLTIEGRHLTSILVNEGDNYQIYKVPALFDGREGAFVVAQSNKNDKFSVLGKVINSGEASGRMEDVLPGETITFMLEVIDLKTGARGYVEGETITWPSDRKPAVGINYVKDGQYRLTFVIEDSFGNTHVSKELSIVKKQNELTRTAL